jgi:hypothetical protein
MLPHANLETDDVDVWTFGRFVLFLGVGSLKYKIDNYLSSALDIVIDLDKDCFNPVKF